MRFTKRHTIAELTSSEKGRAVLKKHLPGYAEYGDFNYEPAMSMPIGIYPGYKWASGLTDEIVQAIVDDMNDTPVEALVPEARTRKSLDELDLESFHAGPSPLSGESEKVNLIPCEKPAARPGKTALSLDGEWLMTGEDALGLPIWNDAIPAPVPGSVHTALVAAGRLPDTTFGRNQELARPQSQKNWWLKKTFSKKEAGAGAKLLFDGVANKCEVYLNGILLGGHEGMFGGPEYDVSGALLDDNELVVRLFGIPEELHDVAEPEPGRIVNTCNNHSWRHTVVSNNVYGWHYSNLPSIGIWNSVRLEAAPDVALPHPFIATVDHETAEMRLAVEYVTRSGAWSGAIRVTIAPENFEAQAHCFERRVADAEGGKLLFAFNIPDARLWWPNNLGEQNLYRLTVEALPEGGQTAEVSAQVFGVRTVRLAPLPYGPRPDRFNWQFIVNGKRMFAKGTGWCTMDAMMDFSDARYERFLGLAHIQNCQMIRAWGAGMPEKDVFYDLCDRYGIMVMQEWPTAWDSHQTQPYEMLEETVALNTLRIRNHPSLIVYCPGNESPNPFGRAIDMMGRLSVELDGTRAFHRGEPWGGSVHNYDSYWGRKGLDFHVNMTGDFFGEFGIACMPCAESVARYLPEGEQGVWPPKRGGAFEYHTPIFGTADDLSRLKQMTGYFTKPGCGFEQGAIASQFSQVLGVRHTLERARVRYPDCGGALYYKLNDNFPAISWSTVDWYGAPKLGHYVFKQSFAPTAALLLPETLNFGGVAHSLPLYLVDDRAAPGDRYEAVARAYDGTLNRVLEKSFRYEGDADVPDLLGTLDFSYEQTNDGPMLICVELRKNGDVVFDTFYFFNYEAKKGCLFDLPRTSLELEPGDGCVVVRNTGDVPCAGVTIEQPGHADSFTAWDGFFWLEPGAQKCVRVSSTDGLRTRALNA